MKFPTILLFIFLILFVVFVYLFIQDSVIDSQIDIENNPFTLISPFFYPPFFLMFAIPILCGIIINNIFATHKYKWLFVIPISTACFITLFFLGFLIMWNISVIYSDI